MLTRDLTPAFLTNLIDSLSLLPSPIFSMSAPMTYEPKSNVDAPRDRGSKFDANYFTPDVGCFRKIIERIKQLYF